MEEVSDEEAVPCEGTSSGTVIVGETTVGKETGRVKIEDASVEVGTTIGTFTNGIVAAKMGETEVDVSVVETRRDVIASSIERMSDDETDEDDTVSGMDGRSDKEAEGGESVSDNVGIFKDGLSEDGGIPTINEAEGGSDSVDVFADGLVLEEYSSVEMKLIV
ncbi:hypothetical protein KI387_043770 [Taxus chinensis]|uniref:Uncharacterized protein n=1 Tax=Taxus chinensis TaxID=29808 RepID=A0AA38GTA9_TAXCH|nr:hypothetical protein KI387_043770 [Taxus chinensis]